MRMNLPCQRENTVHQSVSGGGGVPTASAPRPYAAGKWGGRSQGALRGKRKNSRDTGNYVWSLMMQHDNVRKNRVYMYV